MSNRVNTGTLYIVATPIGNLGDMSQRAIEVLSEVDLVAAEDTRHSLGLFRHLGIQVAMQSLHEHNEREVVSRLIDKLQSGTNLALISDAGTPLISDPGYHLVSQARAAQIPVVPIPGPSAVITALSASGLPTDRFRFEGFLPHKSAARRNRLEQVARESSTLVFYESSHRILASLADMAQVFGGDRRAVIARELTKRFETIKGDSLAALLEWVSIDSDQQKGEFVVMVAGAEAGTGGEESAMEAERVLAVLLEELPLKQAATLAARLTGEKKNRLYQRALELKGEQ